MLRSRFCLAVGEFQRRPWGQRAAGPRIATPDDVLKALARQTSPPVPDFLAPDYAGTRAVRLSPNARAPAVLNAELDQLRWHEDPAKVLGKENRAEVYLARLVATTIWRNRSMSTTQKRVVVQGVIDTLHASIEAQKAPPAAVAEPVLAATATATATAAPAKKAAAKPAAATAAAKPASLAAAAPAKAPAAKAKK